MQPASQCIGTHEPAFRIALVIGLAAALLLAGVLVKLESRLQGKPFVSVRRSLAWAAAEAAVFIGPILLTVLLYAWLHPERQLCTSLVWRWYFLPPVVLVVTGVCWGVIVALLQRRQVRHS